MATSCMAAVVVAVTALSNPEKVPSHLKDTLGASVSFGFGLESYPLTSSHSELRTEDKS